MSFSASVEDLVAASPSALHGAAPWWERVQLGEVASILNGFPWKSDYFNDSTGPFLIRIRDVTTGATETRYSGPIEDGYWIEPGDLLVGMDGDFNATTWGNERALLNQRVCRIDINPGSFDKAFLAYLLPSYLKLINDHTHSVTVKHLSSKTLAEIPLPLPPLTEQRRTVAKSTLSPPVRNAPAPNSTGSRYSWLALSKLSSPLHSAVISPADWRATHDDDLGFLDDLHIRPLAADQGNLACTRFG